MEHPDYLRIPLAGYLATHYGDETRESLSNLAAELQSSFPQIVTVTFGGNWLSRNRPLRSLLLKLENEEFQLDLEASVDTVATRRHVVRGIVLQSERLTMKEWLDHLGKALESYAAGRIEAQEALRRWTS